MPPSPSMRISPGRDSHKRGRSLDRGVMYRDKEDDLALALFNDVQTKETEDFLLQSNDDFDDIFATKLKSFSNHKLGISIPARGQSSDLLNAEGDKNDYDWLITPPETPLFSSLDDEAPAVNLAPRGRPRSQPVSVPRSSSMEKTYRSIRGSPSPQRLSPSPRSGSSILQSRSRPFSATNSSPPPTLRQSPPSRGVSPPPSKSTPPPRSSSPAARRMSTGSASVTSSSKVRGTSPIKTSRGNSTSPKITAWQTTIPGFSSEAPPNLRTSLADRPASYVRGTSPASRNGSRSGRQSMSPTASRSVSSSHSHERDPFSSHSKGSLASSGDDDVDSLQSHPVSSSDRSAPRSVGVFPKSRAVEFSKKPTKTLSSSAPKRSFDLALRQMDRKGPQNMFRPLLSSVPSSTLYAGKASARHRSLTSRNSSITTSSNASSDLGTSGAHDTEESEHNQEDVTSDCVKEQLQHMDDEVFDMDQADVSNEDVNNKIQEESTDSCHEYIDGPSFISSHFHVADNGSELETAVAMDTDVVLDREYDFADGSSTSDIELCSVCGQRFHSSELVVEGELQLCLQCRNLEINSEITLPLETVMVGRNTTKDFVQVQENELLEVLDQSASIPELLQVTSTGENGANHLSSITSEDQCSYTETSHNPAVPVIEEEMLTLATQQVSNQIVDSDRSHQQSQHSGMTIDSKTDVSEGAGMSLLLKQSSTGKRHIVQSRSFTASNLSYDDFSYVTDSLNYTRSSIGQSSASVSSSVDLGSSKQTETRYHWQISGRRSETDNYRYEMPVKHKRSISSLSGASNPVFQVPSVAPSCDEDSVDAIATKVDKEVWEATCGYPHEQSVAFELMDAESTATDLESNDILKAVGELSGRLVIVNSLDTPSEEPKFLEKGDNLRNTCSDSVTVETSSAHLQSSTQGVDITPSLCDDEVDIADVPHARFFDAMPGSEIENPHPTPFDAMPGREIENADITSADTLPDIDSTDSKSCINELAQPSVSGSSNDVLEESRIVMEDTSGTKARSLTLDEATDAILFCSSIVHNLAYNAANIAIEKENLQVEKLRPTVTSVGKSIPDRREVRSRTVGKRSSKSQKARQKRFETDTAPPPSVAENNNKSTPRMVEDPNKGDTMKPPKLESKCNCTIM